MTTISKLINKLWKLKGHAYVNPDGPEAVAAIEALQVELAKSRKAYTYVNQQITRLEQQIANINKQIDDIESRVLS